MCDCFVSHRIFWVDENLVLGEVMRIAFEGPNFTLVDFDNILKIFSKKIVAFY